MLTVDTQKAPRSADLINGYLHYLAIDLDRAETTIDTYADLLARLDRTLPEGLAYACADELRDGIHARGQTAAARNVYRAAVVGFFAWATDPDSPHLDYNPAIKLPRPRVRPRSPRPVTDEELADILARASEPMRTWYLLACGNGLRCVEISRLDRADITEEATWVHGKGDKERTVPTHPAVWEAVKDCPPGPIARSRDGSRATRIQVRRRGNHHLQFTLGHRTVSMHRLRHWHATYVYQSADKDIRVTQELLGHSSPNTTAVYVAALTGAKSDAVRGLALPI